MRLGFRGKVFVLSLCLFVPAGIGSGLFLETRVRAALEQQLEGELLSHARSARTAVEAAQEQSIAAMDPIADRFGEAVGARITIIAGDGTVLADSQLEPGAIVSLESHADRPEVVEARSAGLGTSRRFSASLGTDMLYLAIPGSSTELPTVRVALPLTQVAELTGRLRWPFAFAALLGLAIAVAISAIAAQLLSRRLREVAEHARAVSKGRGAASELPTRDGFYNIAEALDVAMGDLAADRDRFETVLYAMEDGVVAVDESDRITLSNPAAQHLLDLDGEVDGRPLLEVIRVPGLTDLSARVRHEGPVDGEIEVGTPPRVLEVSGAPLRETGGVLLVLRDVTELRHLERVRRDFVANVSHELRTPVSVIRANAETLVDGGLDDAVRGPEFAGAVLRSAERLASLIDDLLDLARLESGELEPSIEAVDVGGAVERALEAIGPAANEREVATSAEVPDGLRVRADSSAFDQIVLNLVENAVKYTRRGGNVSVSAGHDGDVVRLEVADDGPGIAPPERDRIFERFYRVDPGRSRQMGGTGLGLSIVKHLAEAMDGQVGVEPVVPHGARFWVTLPVEKSP